jgi:GGDEF domain-containing protein
VDTVARLAGGEFGVLAPGEGGQVVGDRIRAAVAALDPALGSSISVSIGIARSPQNGTGAAELLAAARAALGSAREKGPGAMVVSTSEPVGAAANTSGEPQP